MSGIIVLLAANGLYAETGFNLLLSANYKAEFGLRPGIYSETDPGADTGIADRSYDDGYNRIDVTGNFDRGTGSAKTYYWGYQDSAQYDAAAQTITMSSQRLNLTEDAAVYEDQHYAQPGLEFWWQETLFTGIRNDPYQPKQEKAERWQWYLNIRAALRWQHVEMKQDAYVSGSLEQVSDVYSTGGALPPAAPFDGTFTGPNMVLDAVPTSRTITPLGGGTAAGQYQLETELFALDLGPSLLFDLGYGARFSISAGATLAWARSDFDYSYDNVYSSRDTVSEPLFGWYAGFDFLFADGVNLGFGTYQLQDLKHSTAGNYATLDFSDSYTFRIGLVF